MKIGNLIPLILLAGCSLAQPDFIPPATATIFDVFLPACHDDSYCHGGRLCLTDGPNANDDDEYYYCAEPATCDLAAARSIDGSCNNPIEGRRLRGSTGHSQLVRVEGEFNNVVSPRRASDVIGAFSPTIPNIFGASTALVMFGQFIDHDITVIHMDASEAKIIPGTGIVPDMLFISSEAIGRDNPEAPFHINDLTAYIDLSQVYGSEDGVLALLRAFSDGLMLSRTGSDGNEYLPLVDSLSPILESDGIGTIEDVVALSFLPGAMAGGDIRANEHLTLNAWHTLFIREHNRLAREILAQNPDLIGNDEEIFQRARKWNIAQYQNIVFGEYFSQWHNEDLPTYSGYDPEETPDLDIYFSTVTYRFGHSGVPNEVLRIDERGTEVGIPLGEAFFRPSQIELNGGVDALLNGARQQCHERIDTYFQEGLRNALFNDIPGLIGSDAMDLYTLNLARARDHELASYPELRAFFGLSELQTFSEVTGDRECVTELLEELYGVDNVAGCDPFVCALAEPATHGEVGETLYESQRDHFRRFRDADRLFFENRQGLNDEFPGPQFTDAELAQIRSIRIHDILARNTFLQTDDPNAANYVRDAFTTDRCARNDGIAAFLSGEDSDQMCVPNGDSEQFTLEVVSLCEATNAIRAGDAFSPGSPECSNTCVCPGLAAVAEARTIAGLSMGSFIGLIVGLVVGVVLVVVIGCVFYKRRKMERELDYTQGDHMSHASGASSHYPQQQFGGNTAPSVHSQAPSVNNYF